MDFIDFHGFSWIFMDFQGFSWISWIFMDFHDLNLPNLPKPSKFAFQITLVHFWRLGGALGLVWGDFGYRLASTWESWANSGRLGSHFGAFGTFFY